MALFTESTTSNGGEIENKIVDIEATEEESNNIGLNSRFPREAKEGLASKGFDQFTFASRLQP